MFRKGELTIKKVTERECMGLFVDGEGRVLMMMRHDTVQTYLTDGGDLPQTFFYLNGKMMSDRYDRYREE